MKSRAPIALALVLLYAALQRILYLAVYPDVMPFFTHPLADARVYESWSSAIAAGDVWSRGEGVFYRAPLYPYLLAAIRWVAGSAMPVAAWFQGLLGMSVLYLVARVGVRAGGPWTGVLAAGILALYGPLLALETKRLPTTLGIFLHVASLLLALRMAERPTRLRGSISGLALGLSALVRPQWLLLALVFAWILAPRDARRSYFGNTGVAFLCMALLVAGLVTVRNRVIGSEWVLISSNGGMTFYQGNNPENQSGLLALAPEMGLMGEAEGQRDAEIRAAERLSGSSLGAAGASRFWFGRGVAFIAEHPGAWLQLELKKLGLLIRSFEYPDNYSFLAERARVWPLWLAPLPFGVLLALGVTGAAVAAAGARGSAVGAKRDPVGATSAAADASSGPVGGTSAAADARSGPVGTTGAAVDVRSGAVGGSSAAGAGVVSSDVACRMVMCSAAWGLVGCLIFYVSSRYRIDAAPALAILGGVALTRGLGLYRHDPQMNAKWVDGSAPATGSEVNVQVTPVRRATLPRTVRSSAIAALAGGVICAFSFWPVGAGVRSQESMATLQLAVAFDANGQPEAAEEAFVEATAWYPENVLAWQRRLESVARRRTPEEALELFANIPPATQSTPPLQYVRGILLEGIGDLHGADAAYRHALVNPEIPEAAARLGGLRARTGAFAEAESLLTLATGSPNAPATAWIALAEVRLRLRDFLGAEGAAQTALAENPRDGRAAVLLAKSRLYLDDPDGARDALLAGGVPEDSIKETLSRLSEEIREPEDGEPTNSPSLPQRE